MVSNVVLLCAPMTSIQIRIVLMTRISSGLVALGYNSILKSRVVLRDRSKFYYYGGAISNSRSCKNKKCNNSIRSMFELKSTFNSFNSDLQAVRNSPHTHITFHALSISSVWKEA